MIVVCSKSYAKSEACYYTFCNLVEMIFPYLEPTMYDECYCIDVFGERYIFTHEIYSQVLDNGNAITDEEFFDSIKKEFHTTREQIDEIMNKIELGYT